MGFAKNWKKEAQSNRQSLSFDLKFAVQRLRIL